MSEKFYLVTNRSAGTLSYSVPDLGIKNRFFQIGETKRITLKELEGLSYIPGGREVMRNYLQIQDVKMREQLIGKTEPEYNMTAEDIKNLILTGSQDEWLDCLDFAPEGVIDLIRQLSVELPLTDTNKMESFKEKTGINIARAIQAKKEEEAEVAAAAKKEEQEKPQRRVNITPVEKTETTPARRTSGSKYAKK